MMTYQNHIDSLAALETFDYKAFIADTEVPKNVSALMLSLAVVYNDLRDVSLLMILLKEMDIDLSQKNQKVGQFSALVNNANRLLAGTLNELFHLLRDNQKAIEHVSFNRVVKKLSRKARESWSALIEVSDGGKVDNSFGKQLMFIRNKVAFHYDPKIIAKGYSNCFAAQDPGNVPYVSRGNSMKETRFYFADAATQNYMNERENIEGTWEALRTEVMKWVNQALYELVTKFPVSRGYAWRTER